MATESAPSYTYECINMTFEEAYETMANGEPLMVVGMLTVTGAVNLQGFVMFTGIAAFGVPCLMVGFVIGSTTLAQLYWTAEGLSTSEPSNPSQPEK